MKLDVEVVSFSSYDFPMCIFLCTSKVLFFAFIGNLKRFLTHQRPFRDPGLDEVLQFRPQLGQFSTLKSLNQMTMDGGLRAYYTIRDAFR